jgi:Cof subfamily protein (haloacid dehalogenase superfamily)
MYADLTAETHLGEKLAAIRLVLMDVDGTLVSGPTDSLQRVVSQLQRLRAHGIRFSIATGRTLFGAAAVIEPLRHTRAKLPPIIAYNGAVVAGPGPVAVIDRALLSRPAFQKALKVCRSLRMKVLVYVCAVDLDLAPREFVYSSDREKAGEQEFNGMDIQFVPWRKLALLDDVVSILAITRSAKDSLQTAGRLQDELRDDLRVTTSGNIYVEIASKGTTKMRAMTRLATMLHLTPAQIMAIGDNFNDLEMLMGSGLGVAVANSPPGVKRIANLVSTRDGSEGVVETLRMLLDAQRMERLERRVLSPGGRK